jgi:hypothetical protein
MPVFTGMTDLPSAPLTRFGFIDRFEKGRYETMLVRRFDGEGRQCHRDCEGDVIADRM